MRLVNRLFLALMRDRKGATAVEYGLILALIFLALVGSVRGVGGATSTVWNNVSNKVDAVTK